MESRESEKMRLELESFLNTSLTQTKCAWPVKHLEVLKQKSQQKDDTGVLVGESPPRS